MREKLATRLTALLEPYGDRIDDHWDEVLLVLADECIRQMEWARRVGTLGGIHEALLTTESNMNDPKPGYSLTIAPEDWTP